MFSSYTEYHFGGGRAQHQRCSDQISPKQLKPGTGCLSEQSCAPSRSCKSFAQRPAASALIGRVRARVRLRNPDAFISLNVRISFGSIARPRVSCAAHFYSGAHRSFPADQSGCFNNDPYWSSVGPASRHFLASHSKRGSHRHEFILDFGHPTAIAVNLDALSDTWNPLQHIERQVPSLSESSKSRHSPSARRSVSKSFFEFIRIFPSLEKSEFCHHNLTPSRSTVDHYSLDYEDIPLNPLPITLAAGPSQNVF